MVKATPSAALILKDIRAALDSRLDGKGDRGDKSKGIVPKSPLKALGVRPSLVRSIAREIEGKTRPSMEYPVALALVDAAVARKVREEILVALEVFEHHQKEFAPGLFAKVEKWSAVADDLEVAEVLGTRVAAPALRLEPSKLNVVKKWAKLKSLGKRHLAVLAATGLVMDGHREAAAVLNLAETLLDGLNPAMVGAVARPPRAPPGAPPNSGRVYVSGKLHPELRVPFRQIKLSPTRSFNGQAETNPPVRVYDCSGPWGDSDFTGIVEHGLPALRSKWILARADVEQVPSSYKPIPGRSDATIPPTLRRQPLRAKPGKAVTQLYYARQGRSE